MDFQELMRHAADNKNNAMRQKKKSGQAHQDNTPKVSGSAIKAFIAKKEEEKKIQQAEAEAARRARIQARLEENLTKKSAKKDKSSKKSETPQSQHLQQSRDGEDPSKRPGKIPSKKAPPQERRQELRQSKPEKLMRRTLPESTEGEVKNKSKLSGTQNRKTLEKSQLNGKTVSSTGSPMSSMSSKKSSKGTKKHPKPVDFKELLAIAERNKSSGGGASKVIMEKPPGKESSADTSKRKREEPREHSNKATKQTRQPSQGKAIKETKTNHSVVKGLKEKVNQVRTNEKHLKSETVAKASLSKGIKSGCNLTGARDRDRPGPSQERLPVPPHMRYQSRHMDDTDEFDDFIDDGEDDNGEDDNGQPDVSSYIRQIFGYDKRKYDGLQDVDDRVMETSFAQMQREEVRSSKIAKLEDEVEFLKEQAMLKRQKAGLMKEAKKYF